MKSKSRMKMDIIQKGNPSKVMEERELRGREWRRTELQESERCPGNTGQRELKIPRQ